MLLADADHVFYHVPRSNGGKEGKKCVIDVDGGNSRAKDKAAGERRNDANSDEEKGDGPVANDRTPLLLSDSSPPSAYVATIPPH